MPEWSLHFGFLDIFCQGAFVGLFHLGLLSAYRPIRRFFGGQTASFTRQFCEAALIMPWLLYPLLTLLSVTGFFRLAIISSQVVFVALGTSDLIRRRKSIRPVLADVIWRGDAPDRILNSLALLTAAFFMYWGWIMPFSEPFNGYHHALVNLIQHLWKTGQFVFPALRDLSYDNLPILTPINYNLYLALFSSNVFPSVGVHPLFLLPGLWALMSLFLFGDIFQELGFKRSLGSLTFVLIAFSYRATAEWAEFAGDLFSVAVLLLFFLCLFRWKRTGQPDIFLLLFIFCFTFVTRKQVFLIAGMILAAALLTKRLKLAFPSPKELRLAARSLLVALPLLFFLGLMTRFYNNPFFPMGTFLDAPVVSWFFDTRPFVEFQMEEEKAFTPPPPLPFLEAQQAKWRKLIEARQGDGSFLMEHYFPISLKKGPLVLLKNVFCGLSLSLLVSTCFILYLMIGWRHEPWLYRFAWLSLFSYAVIGYVFFPLYGKFAGYFSPLAAIYAVLLLHHLFGEKKLGRWAMTGISGITFFVGLMFWAFNTWGHGEKDPTFENLKFLRPGYKDAISRLGRKSGQTVESLQMEITEYNHALDRLQTGERILYMDLEPGTLVPAIVNRDYVGDFYYLENNRSTPVLAATTFAELKSAFEKTGIRFVYRPGREPRPSLLVNRLMAAYLKQPHSRYQHVVPVEELLLQSPL